MSRINLYNSCSLEAMKKMKDNTYTLAVVDPPYGVTKGMDKRGLAAIPSSSKYKSRNRDLYKSGEDGGWNVAPTEEYFQELKRVSKNQIIWGGNYFPCLWTEPVRGFIFWDKRQISKLHADGEMAYTSFDANAKRFVYRWAGAHTEFGSSSKVNRIHPTQKPVALYSWIFRTYTKPGDTVLDTHLGSGSIAIAAIEQGVHLDGYEIHQVYYERAKKRLEQYQDQLQLFQVNDYR